MGKGGFDKKPFIAIFFVYKLFDFTKVKTILQHLRNIKYIFLIKFLNERAWYVLQLNWYHSHPTSRHFSLCNFYTVKIEMFLLNKNKDLLVLGA